MLKKCNICLSEFNSERNASFCSANCRSKHRYSLKKDEIKAQQKKYNDLKKNKSRLSRNGTLTLQAFELHCIECDVIFATNRYNKITCTDNCKKKRNARLKKDKLKQDSLFCLTVRIRTLISTVYYNQGYTKSSSCNKIIGLNFIDFKKHLATSFENEYGIPFNFIDLGLLEIDHIIPVSSANSEEELLSLNHYSNLRLIFTEDNRKKSNKGGY